MVEDSGAVSATADAGAGDPAPRSRRLVLGRTARIVVGIVVAAGIVTGAVILAPTLRATAAELVGADPWWVVLAVLCELGALVAFAAIHQRLLSAAGVRVRLREVTLVTMAANALHLTVPGGAAVSTAYTYRRRRIWGASAPVTTWTLVAGGVALLSLTIDDGTVAVTAVP